MDGRSPCVIGVAQRTVRAEEGPAPEPLVLWEQVCRAAAADTSAPAGRVLSSCGSLSVLYCQSWQYDDPAQRLGSALGISPPLNLYSGIGGTTPQLLVTDAARKIAAGDLDLAIVVGGEALETVRQTKKAGGRPEWSHRDPERKPFPFEAPFHPAEMAHGVFQAWLTFAVFDVARRAHLGVDPTTYRRSLGDLLEPMTDVAAGNPHAWFRDRRSASELIDPVPSNRMVGYPYTKMMVSIMDVDMAAALVVASHETADSLGVPQDRRVYLRGSAYAEDPVYLAEHERLWASPAMSWASSTALSAAGAGIDDVAHMDLYSCFTSSVNLACDALSLAPGDPRGTTVTGGLPFAGGPGSGYVLHSIASMVDVLRSDPGSLGMVSGVGMHMTKHAYTVLSSDPPGSEMQSALGARSDGREQRRVPITDVYAGDATVATYTVVHGRGGEREWGLAICDLPDGSRAYARVEDQSLLEEAEEAELVGAEVRLTAGADRVNLLTKI
jgi:acetyl-CoA C-acetyltransferase